MIALMSKIHNLLLYQILLYYSFDKTTGLGIQDRGAHRLLRVPDRGNQNQIQHRRLDQGQNEKDELQVGPISLI